MEIKQDILIETANGMTIVPAGTRIIVENHFPRVPDLPISPPDDPEMPEQFYDDAAKELIFLAVKKLKEEIKAGKYAGQDAQELINSTILRLKDEIKHEYHDTEINKLAQEFYEAAKQSAAEYDAEDGIRRYSRWG